MQGGETAEVELRLKPDGVGFAVRAVLATGLSAGSPAEAGGGRDDPASRGLALPGRVSGQKGAPIAPVRASDSLGELPLEDRQWEAVEAASAAAHEATLAGAGSAQEATEDDTASARAERETGSAATGLSVAGLPVTQDAETVDGLSADQGFRSGPRGSAAGGPRLGSGFAQGAVRSVRVMPGTFSAQYGGAAGALVAVSARSAGAVVHGNAFVQDRESAWAAVNPFAVVSRYQGGVVSNVLERPGEADRQFGGALGLPLLRRGRLGVFAAYEGQRRDQTLVSSPQTCRIFPAFGDADGAAGEPGRGRGGAAGGAGVSRWAGWGDDGRFAADVGICAAGCGVGAMGPGECRRAGAAVVGTGDQRRWDRRGCGERGDFVDREQPGSGGGGQCGVGTQVWVEGGKQRASAGGA